MTTDTAQLQELTTMALGTLAVVVPFVTWQARRWARITRLYAVAVQEVEKGRAHARKLEHLLATPAPAYPAPPATRRRKAPAVV